MKAAVSIILVEPENPDNIGASARAMKNMGLPDLRLVSPPSDWQEKAKKMAVGASDLLLRARVYPSLADAVKDRQVVIATTRRRGARRNRYLPFDHSIALASGRHPRRACAFVFGKESKGLTNRDLERCHWLTTIPSDPAYPSLNLAQAVMVVAFSVCMVRKRKTRGEPAGEEAVTAAANLARGTSTPVTQEETQDMLGRFREAVLLLGYRREGPDIIDRIVATLHGLVKRAGLLRSEVHMLKGLTRRIAEKIKKKALQ